MNKNKEIKKIEVGNIPIYGSGIKSHGVLTDKLLNEVNRYYIISELIKLMEWCIKWIMK